MRSPLAIAALLAACRTPEDPSAEIAALQAEVDALEAQVQALAAQVEAQPDPTLRADLDALGARVDALDAAGADVDGRLLALEEADLATRSWVEGQGYLVPTALDPLTARLGDAELLLADHEARLDGHDVEIGTLSSDLDDLSDEADAARAQIAANAAAVSAAGTEIATHASLLATLSARGDALETDLGAVEGAVADLAEADEAHDDALAALGEDVDAVEARAADLEARATDLEARATDLESRAADVEARASDLESRAADVEARASDLESRAGEVEGGLADLGARTQDVEARAGDLEDAVDALGAGSAALETDVADLLDAVDALEAADAGHDEALRQSFSGSHPALWEYVRSGWEDTYAHGAAGFPLLTSGGAFYLSGWLTSTDSNRIWMVTFYVDNPGAAAAVTLEMCRGDYTSVYLDGALVASPSDLDGACSALSPISFSAGPHVLQIRYSDPNNFFEGLGIRNAWLEDHGLEIDWDAMRAAMSGDL